MRKGKTYGLILFTPCCINSHVWAPSSEHVLCEGLRLRDIAMAEGLGFSVRIKDQMRHAYDGKILWRSSSMMNFSRTLTMS